MTSQNETISKRTLIFRYAALAILTAYLTTMVVITFMLLHREVKRFETYNGWRMENVSFFNSFYDFARIRKSQGVVVSYIDPLSPAEQCGLEVGDTIVALNGMSLTEHPQSYFQFTLSATAGDSARLTVRKNGVIKDKMFIMADRDSAFSKMGHIGVVRSFMNRDSLKARGIDSDSGIFIEAVDRGMPAEAAGLKPRDALTMFNGIRIKSDTQFTRLVLMTPPGKSVTLKCIRDGSEKSFVATLASRPSAVNYGIYFFGSDIRGSPAKVVWTYYLPWMILPLLLLLVGAFIGWMRPRDSIAFDSAMLFLCFGSAVALGDIPNKGSLSDWLLIIHLCGVDLVAGMAFPFAFRLLSVFPVPTKLGKIFLRWQWIAFVLFGLYGAKWFIDEISIVLGWYNPIPFEISDMWATMVLCIGMIAFLAAQRVKSRHQPQNRLRLFEFSVLLGAVAGLVFAFRFILFSIIPVWLEPLYGYVAFWLPLLLWIVFPLSFAYTVLTKKVFGIRFFIRKGLRYLLLSKGALIVEGIIVFFIVIQILSYAGTVFLNSPTAVGGVAVASTLAVIAVVGRVNRKLMPVIDRRFFREALDVQKLLLDLNQQLSAIREREQILQQTANAVLRALHPARVVMLLKHGKSDEFRCELTLENERAKPTTPSPTRHSEPCPDPDEVGRRIDSESEPSSAQMLNRVQQDALSGTVLRTDDPIIKLMEEKKGWTIVYPEKLDPEKDEDQRLSAVNCELLIAIRGSSGLIGVMGLGDKLSEEPYSKEDRELLLTVAHEIGMALENAELLEVAKREAEFSKELDIARQVQQNLFPKILPTPTGWEFAGICKPAKAVGGDYYDIFEAVPGKVVVALGDVSGKGLGASFVMSGVHSTIRTQVKKSLDNPVEIIDELNEYLLGSTSKNIFVTLFLGIIDLENGQMQYVNCGHPPAFVVRKENSEIEKLTRTGLALGMMNTVQFTQGTSTLKVGDSLIVYSDGITEAMNEKEEMYEEERLTQLLTTTLGLDTSHMMEAILKSVDKFAGTHEQADDISVIVVRRNESTPL